MDLESIRARLAERAPVRADAAGAAPAAVSLILAGGRNKSLDILFIKRSEHPRDPWSGQMALPGGRRDSGDGNLLATACRETLEETGIQLREKALLGELDDLRPRGVKLPKVVVRPFVFGLNRRPRVRASAEVAGHVWISLNDLRASSGTAEVDIRGRRTEVRAYLVGPRVIWGMTERMLTRFLDLL